VISIFCDFYFVTRRFVSVFVKNSYNIYIGVSVLTHVGAAGEANKVGTQTEPSTLASG
jgi:hypothetical protein